MSSSSLHQIFANSAPHKLARFAFQGGLLVAYTTVVEVNVTCVLLVDGIQVRASGSLFHFDGAQNVALGQLFCSFLRQF